MIRPLIDLLVRCINNDPSLRPPASKIVGQVSQVASKCSASFVNRLEMLKQIEAEKRALTEEGERKDRASQEKEDEILICRIEVQTLTREGERKDKKIQQKECEIATPREEVQGKKSTEIEQLKLAHSSELKQLQLQVRFEYSVADANSRN